MCALAMLAQGGSPAYGEELANRIVLVFLLPVVLAVVIAIALAMSIRPPRREETSPEQLSSKDDVRLFVSGCLLVLAFGIGACYAWFAASVLFR